MSHDYATPEGTARFATRLGGPLPRRTLGKTDLDVARIGFGSCRVRDDNAQHHEALRRAILSGCNLIDTSANYEDGASERLIGDVVHELIDSGKLSRDEIVVVSKAGYVQGSNLELARERVAEGAPFPEMLEYNPDCWHCISPDFLSDQITRSLERLQLSRIDVLLLHNPEYFLETSTNHREYYRRIRQAFEQLELEAKSGRIGFYGISSNTFPEPRESRKFTSLETVCEIADEIHAKRFAIIQFPMNLFEPGAALEQNCGGKTLLEFAREKGIATLINRPLNAFRERKLVRLADFPAHDGEDIAGDLKAAWTRAMELESLIPSSSIAWGHVLKQNFNRISEIEGWKHLVQNQIEPSLAELLERTRDDADLRHWGKQYHDAGLNLARCFTAYLENQAAYQSDVIASKLDHACPELSTSETLSQKVIRLYLSLGVDCVLVGMREPRYVHDLARKTELIPEEKALSAILVMQET